MSLATLSNLLLLRFCPTNQILQMRESSCHQVNRAIWKLSQELWTGLHSQQLSDFKALTLVSWTLRTGYTKTQLRMKSPPICTVRLRRPYRKWPNCNRQINSKTQRNTSPRAKTTLRVCFRVTAIH